jgi:hypothetical protein
MDIIEGKIVEIRNDYEDVFHITVEAQIPEGVALVRIDPRSFGTDPVTSNRWSGKADEAYQLIATTIGQPALNVGDSVPVEAFDHNEVVLKDGQTVPFSEL